MKYQSSHKRGSIILSFIRVYLRFILVVNAMIYLLKHVYQVTPNEKPYIRTHTFKRCINTYIAQRYLSYVH